MSYAKVIELLQQEGFDVSNLQEHHGVTVLPVEGEYVYFAEDLRFAGAVYDKFRGEWIVVKDLPVTHNDAQTQIDILGSAINYLSYPIDTQNPVVAKPCVERARNAMQVIESFLKECEAKL